MTIASTSTNGSLNGSQVPTGGGGSQIGTKAASSVDPLRVLRKYKFAFVLAAIVGGVLGAGAHFALAEVRPTWSTPVIYKCYPPQTRPNPEQMAIDDNEFERFMATEAAMMVSENVLRQAVENPRLQNEAPKWIQRHTTGGVVNVGQAALDLEEQVGARVMAGTDLIRMTVSWSDRQEVATIAEVVNAAYMQDLRRRGSRSTNERRDAIEEAIEGLESDFDQSDRRRNEIVSTRRMDVLDINQSQERAEMMIVLGSMQEIGLQLEALMSQKAEMEAQLRNPGGLQFNDSLRAQVELQPLIQNLRSQVVFLQAQRATERERLGEDNPVIRRIDDQIAALERSLDQQRQQLMEELFQTQLDQLRLGEQQLRAQMASLADRRAELGIRLQELVFAETELSDIERRMEQILTLQQEFETDLRMLEATSQMTTASRVEVIQSPRVPTQMAFPKIYILVPAGMIVVVGLVAG
ncbi:MAG: GumC family protein, partial [Phycisphaerales bacterium JB060]